MAKMLSTTQKHIIISAGGTGGHVIPALTVAKALLAAGYMVSWIGTQQGLESTLVPEAGIKLAIIPKCSVQGKSFLGKALTLCQLCQAVVKSFFVLRRHKASLVIGLGGYVSAAVGIAAKLSSTPLIIHEQNALAGRTNKWLAKMAERVLCAFPHTFPEALLPEVMGNPIREDLLKLVKQKNTLGRSEAKTLNVLVVGGSLGAQVFNEVVPAALSLLPTAARPNVWQQTGEKTYSLACENYRQHGIEARLEPFINNMSKAYAFADLVICRAGALTISELCAVGVPAILVPYPYALDNHQRYNAEILSKKEASIMITQSDFTAKHLTEWLKKLSNQPKLLSQMTENMLPLAKRNSTQSFVGICQTLLN